MRSYDRSCKHDITKSLKLYVNQKCFFITMQAIV